ncbi:MAG: sulfatase-like hydrolase/transferase, partial [Gammaproteobacteria bacterium]|nr:sulfatase-like hydrolase/transferase [Gammaproteobacteria bacterium]
MSFSLYPLLRHWGRDLQLALFIILTLQGSRLLLIFWFYDQRSGSGPGDLLQTLFTGLRYDISTAASWTLLTFLLAPILIALRRRHWLQTLRKRVATLYLLCATPLFAANLVFFDEFGDQFNQRIFALAEDATTAILITLWKSYHPVWLVAATVVVLLLLHRWQRRWMVSPTLPRLLTRARSRCNRGLITAAVALTVIALLRGGSLWGEPIRLKHAFVVRDHFLNHTILNPLTALRYTLDARRLLGGEGGFQQLWPEGSLASALAEVAPYFPEGMHQSDHLDLRLSHVSRGGATPPSAIYLIVMESHSGWTIAPPYRHFGFSPQLAQLAANGIYFPNFLPSGGGTMPSLGALMTGLPPNGLSINYEDRSLDPYPSGVATLMQQLGYHTRLFYGGYLSWQRLDTFARNQSFGEIHGGGQMEGSGARGNEWGVDDKVLFDYILSLPSETQPSFNLIMTTTNHPPYDLDLHQEGFPHKSLPQPLHATKDETLSVLGHLWYADRELGRFVRSQLRRQPDTLFVITADHTARLAIRFAEKSPVTTGGWQQLSVPLVLYSPHLLP